jgi:hypothetical protein
MAVAWVDEFKQDWPRAVVRWGAGVLGAVSVAAIVLLTNGSILAPIALPIGVGVMLALLTHPAWAYSLLVFCTLLFEQYQIFGVEAPVTLQIPFFENFNNSIGIPLPTNPVECLLGLMVFSWLSTIVVTRKIRFHWNPFQGIYLVWTGTLVFFVAFGIGRGGLANIALWEVRALLYMCITYFVGSQLIKSYRDVWINTWCILIPISIKGFQGLWRWAITLDFDIGDVQAITSHECAVFMVTSFIFTLNLVLYGVGRHKLMLGYLIATMPSLLIGFLFAQRRVAYGCLVFGVIFSFVFLPSRIKRKFVNVALPMIPVVLLYFVAFWNSTSGLAMPVVQVRSIFMEDASGEVDSSNVYRDVEKFNLVETVRTYPAGVGFGNKYLIVMPLDEVDFPLWEYIPHNCILWIWVKMGFFGITCFLATFGLLVIQTIIDFKSTTRVLYKSLQVTLVTFLLCQAIVAYYDLQLTFYRNMIYLGAFSALMGPIHAEAKRNKAKGIDSERPEPEPDELDEEGELLPCP